MASVTKSTFLWCLVSACTIIGFGCLMAFLLMMSSTNTNPESISSPDAPITRSLPIPLNPDVLHNRPDIFLEDHVTLSSASNNYKSDVKKNQNLNGRKPQGRMFPLKSFSENDSGIGGNLESLLVSQEAVYGINGKILAILSSLVSRNPSIKEPKTNSGENLDHQQKMSDLLTSIVSRDISSTARQDMLNTLSVIVSEPDIRDQMSEILVLIVNQQNTDEKLKTEMAAVMARIVSQDIDELLTWKMFRILKKITSEETNMDVKKKLVTVLSAIVREENSIELQLKTTNVLSTIIHQYGMDDTRSKMLWLLSNIVPSEEDVNQKPKMVNLLRNVIGANPREDEPDMIAGMVNVISSALDEEKGNKVASQLISLESLLEPSEHSRMTASMTNVLSEMVSVRDLSGKTMARKTGPVANDDQKREMVQLFLNMVDKTQAPEIDRQGQMVGILSKLVGNNQQASDADLDKLSGMVLVDLLSNMIDKTPGASLDKRAEMIRMFSTLVNTDDDSEVSDQLKASIGHVLSTIIHKTEVQEPDFKPKMNRLLSNIVDGEKEPKTDFDIKSKMNDVFSTIIEDKKIPEADFDMKAEMDRVFSGVIHEN